MPADKCTGHLTVCSKKSPPRWAGNGEEPSLGTAKHPHHLPSSLKYFQAACRALLTINSLVLRGDKLSTWIVAVKKSLMHILLLESSSRLNLQLALGIQEPLQREAWGHQCGPRVLAVTRVGTSHISGSNTAMRQLASSPSHPSSSALGGSCCPISGTWAGLSSAHLF